MPDAAQLLIIEDDPRLVEVLADGLRPEALNKILAYLIFGIPLGDKFTHLFAPACAGFDFAHFQRYILADRAVQPL